MPIKHLKNELIKVFKKELRVKVKEKSKIHDFEKWDSLGNFNFLIAIEKHFKFRFSPDQMSEVKTIKQILKILKDR